MPDAGAVEVRMHGEHPLDVAKVAGPMRDRFHDDQVFGRDDGDPEIADAMRSGARDALLLEGKGAEADVEIDRARFVPEQEHTGPAGEGQHIGAARMNIEARPRGEKRLPAVVCQPDESVDIARDPRAAENRGRHTTDNDARDLARRHPAHQIAEGRHEGQQGGATRGHRALGAAEPSDV